LEKINLVLIKIPSKQEWKAKHTKLGQMNSVIFGQKRTWTLKATDIGITVIWSRKESKRV